MKHLVCDSKNNDYLSIEEDLTSKQVEIEIFNESINDSCFIRLDLPQLHSFIGTLLHVQQKIKNT